MSSPRSHRAFQLAAARWFTATGEAERLSTDEDSVRFAAIGEVLFWGAAISDDPGHGGSSADDLCQALHFARNRATHDLLRTVQASPGAIFPMTFPFRFQHFVWRNASELPLPTSGMGSGPGGKAQRQAYERGWEGRHVDETLRQLATHFGIALAF